MPTSVLIVSTQGDVHAYAVAEALRLKGAECVLWLTSDYPTVLCETVLFQDGQRAIELVGPELRIEEPRSRFDTVWHRRPRFVLDDGVLHPADVGFAELGCKAFRESLLTVLAPDAFWVNRREAANRAGGKIVQHHAALRCGFRVPDTLYSNSPDRIRTFIREHGGRIAFKPLKSLAWRSEGTVYMPYTSFIGESDLPGDELLMRAPAIYQAIAPKAFELRVTVMGKRVFAVQIDSQNTHAGRVDWRKAYSELTMRSVALPQDVEQRCVRVVEDLGLVFGCIDLVVGPDGTTEFLEVNQMGQFLFLENYAQVPLLDAFSEFLIQGRPDFNWSQSATSLKYTDVYSEASRRAENPAPGHVLPPESENYWTEPTTPPASTPLPSLR